MKTDNDLLDELFRSIVKRTGASPVKIHFIVMHQFRHQLLANLNVKPTQPLTDEEFEEKLEKMEKEIPLFVDYLMSNDFGGIRYSLGVN